MDLNFNSFSTWLFSTAPACSLLGYFKLFHIEGIEKQLYPSPPQIMWNHLYIVAHPIPESHLSPPCH